jgi:trehalose 6-phosphate phosphatase
MDLQAAVEILAAGGEPLLVVCDYDGTLAPIVADPELAVPAPGAVEALGELRDSGALVALVSGRPVDYLLRHVELAGIDIIGQYGLERAVAGEAVADPRVHEFAAAVRAAADECEAAFDGLYIERKGMIAVTVHWRALGTLDAASIAEIDAIARRHGLVVHETRMARELRVPLPVDKGAAVASLVRDHAPRTALFGGDDRGDLTAFAALTSARDDGRLVTAVNVGVVSSEAPREIVEGADLLVDGPAGFVALLGALTHARRASRATTPE